MLNKVVLKTWLDHLGCFLHSVIIIDISANLGANAGAAVWKKNRERITGTKRVPGLRDENAMTDGQSLNQTQNSLIS